MQALEKKHETLANEVGQLRKSEAARRKLETQLKNAEATIVKNKKDLEALQDTCDVQTAELTVSNEEVKTLSKAIKTQQTKEQTKDSREKAAKTKAKAAQEKMSADIERLEKALSETEESKTDLERKNKETSDALKIAKRTEGDLTKSLKNRDSQLATTQKEHYEECKKASEKMSNYKKKK